MKNKLFYVLAIILITITIGCEKEKEVSIFNFSEVIDYYDGNPISQQTNDVEFKFTNDTIKLFSNGTEVKYIVRDKKLSETDNSEKIVTYSTLLLNDLEPVIITIFNNDSINVMLESSDGVHAKLYCN